jgi:Fe-S cluster assembly protein SufD
MGAIKKDIFQTQPNGSKSTEYLFSILKKRIEQELNLLMTHNSKLNQARVNALNYVLKNGLPNKKQKGWGYTELTWWLGLAFSENRTSPSRSDEYLKILPPKSEFFILVLNGKVQKDLCNLPNNISITDLEDLKEDVLIDILNQEQLSTSTFAQLNCGLVKNGFLLKGSDAELVRCINILYVQSGKSNENYFNQMHNVYMLKENCQLNIVERFWCAEGAHFNNTISQSFLAKKAKLTKYSLGSQANPNSLCQSMHTEFIQQKNNSESKLYKFYFSEGKFKSEGVVRNNILVNLDGEDSKSDIYSISMLSKKTHVDNNIVVNHNKPNNTSSQIFKGVYDGESSGVFDSCVVVKKDAQKTQTTQKNNNILLSSKSSINTNPQLEIFADDVECAHGSTTGELDQNALFYLNSRGLSKKAATSLLLSGFISEVTKAISEETVKKELFADLNKQLNL